LRLARVLRLEGAESPVFFFSGTDSAAGAATSATAFAFFLIKRSLRLNGVGTMGGSTL